jgi:hypothetical protein
MCECARWDSKSNEFDHKWTNNTTCEFNYDVIIYTKTCQYKPTAHCVITCQYKPTAQCVNVPDEIWNQMNSIPNEPAAHYVGNSLNSTITLKTCNCAEPTQCVEARVNTNTHPCVWKDGKTLTLPRLVLLTDKKACNSELYPLSTHCVVFLFRQDVYVNPSHSHNVWLSSLMGKTL